MIWPFNSTTKQAILEVPATPWSQQVSETLIACKRDALALNFIKLSSDDTTTRGRFIAVIERMLELAPQVDWSGERGEYIAIHLIAYCTKIVKQLHAHELDMSFTEAIMTADPFSSLSYRYAQMKERAGSTSDFAQVRGAAEQVIFPTFAHLSEELQARVAELAVAWQARSGQELSIEDRYFVEALATSYLPESISLFGSLCKDPTLVPQAEEMFSQQIKLLRERLLTIEDLTAKRQLQAMAVHSAFLQERLRPEPETAERLSIAR